MGLIATTAQKKIKKLKKRHRVICGGTSASKTYTIIPLLMTYAIKVKNMHISIVSESYPHLRRGCIRDFERIMRETGNWNSNNWNVANSTYTFNNGSKIEFFSADKPDKLRGARRDILFINEANNIPFEAYLQLMIRTRLFCYLDFNPSHEFWAHTELEGRDDVDWLTLTYKDNEATPKEVVRDLQAAEERAKTSEFWANWVKVYVFGQLGTMQEVIYKEHDSWEQVSTIPADAELMGYGLDFGYTNDPSACIAVFYMDGNYYLDEVFYDTRMTNKDIANKLKNNGLAYVRGYADSAEPKSIDFINSEGVNIEGVTKGPDSISYGIDLVKQEGKVFVTQRSLNLIKELRNYRYEKDQKTGKVINKPAKNQNDHACDAMRYWFMMGARGKWEHIVV